MVEYNEEDWGDDMNWEASNAGNEIPDDIDYVQEVKLKKLRIDDVKPTVRNKIKDMQELFSLD
jgi:hypothetical protein